MNYQETLHYLYGQLPMFTRVGASAYKADLDNTIALCLALGNPERKFKSIHVAGTNGKGSTSHMLASVLQEQGLKVGLYTSPHLKDFRERIKINGVMIEEQEVVDFVNMHKPLFDKIMPSFFEWTVALCFNYFAAQKVDIAIIETGLGGRLDSTNVITPELSIITNIGWDHTDLLGDTLEKIAIEKAGIIKPNISCVIGEVLPETAVIFGEKSKKENAPILFAPQESQLNNFTLTDEGVKFIPQIKNNKLPINTDDYMHCDLGGIYQQFNINTVLVALNELQNLAYSLSASAIVNGLKNVKQNTGLMGRWQVLSNSPKVICDTGHNVNGIYQVVKQIALQQFDKLHMVIGMVKDKDISKVLAELPANATYYFCKAQLPRALNEVDLQLTAQQFNLVGEAYETVALALQAAKKNATQNDFIFVGGSTFVVAEAI
ncbi:MAG: folylpolyglutamate synthase/dihydrofolate synthase family protein [Bacteroidota bacterium]